MLRRRRRHPLAFTLLELVLVMAIIAILAGVMVPTLSSFAAGRRTNNAATTVLGLANYARAQSIAEGTVYRLNFDSTDVWLTRRDLGGAFAPVNKNGYNAKFPMPDGVRLWAEVTAGTVVIPVASPSVQTQMVEPTPIVGTQLATPNTLVQYTHTDGGTYVEFQPSGRTDPCHIRVNDTSGHAIEIGAATATDVVHVLKPGEM